MARRATRAKTRRDNGSGRIYKQGDHYRAAILVGYDPKTGKEKLRSARAKTHAEAVEKLQAMLSDQHRGLTIQSGSTSLDTYALRWLETIRETKSPNTVRHYEYILRKLVLPSLGKKPLQRIDRATVQALINSLAKKHVEPRTESKQAKTRGLLTSRTLTHVKTVLHTVFAQALADDLVARNPCTGIKIKADAKKQPTFLTAEQVSKLRKSLEGSPVGEVVRFMLETGTRSGEARGIRWQDVDLDTKTVAITGQLQRINGTLTRIETTKTNQDRKLPLTNALVTMFKELKAWQLYTGFTDPDGLVFLNTEGRRFDEKYVSTHLKKACAAAGVPQVSCHKLRHTFASLVAQSSGDIHAVQKLLGHAQVSLTADLYGHRVTESLRNAVDELSRITE